MAGVNQTCARKRALFRGRSPSDSDGLRRLRLRGVSQPVHENKITLIGCPKLDEGDCSEKLTAIIKNNNIKSVTVVQMEVPFCGGIEHAAVTALKQSGKFILWQVHTLSTDGQLLAD